MASSINASTSGAGGVITTADNTGNLELQSSGSAIATLSSTGLSMATGKTFSVGGVTSSPYAMKNRIINGAMVIDQRKAGASVTPASGSDYYSCDRWQQFLSQSSKYSIEQNITGVAGPAGFINYLAATSLSAYSVLSTDNFALTQQIEGNNIADLGWGAAGASTVTLSFWVRSSLTGTFGGAFSNSAVNRSYPFSYTISAANTWEQKTITVAGDTSGTWLTDTGIGLRVWFSLGAGSTYLGTAGAWAAADYRGATGQTSVVATNAATFYITGVQLEVGSSATSFEFKLYNQELANCQRYFEKSGVNQSIALAASSRFPAFFAVTKRTDPTLVYTFAAGTNTVSLESPTVNGFRFFTTGSVATPCDFTWTASAEL